MIFHDVKCSVNALKMPVLLRAIDIILYCVSVLTHWYLRDFNGNFSYVTINHVLLTGICRSLYDNDLRWMPWDLTDDNKSTLVEVMAWCRQATSQYLSQYGPRPLLPYGITWYNELMHCSWCTEHTSLELSPLICIQNIPHHSTHSVKSGTPYGLLVKWNVLNGGGKWGYILDTYRQASCQWSLIMLQESCLEAPQNSPWAGAFALYPVLNDPPVSPRILLSRSYGLTNSSNIFVWIQAMMVLCHHILQPATEAYDMAY